MARQPLSSAVFLPESRRRCCCSSGPSAGATTGGRREVGSPMSLPTPQEWEVRHLRIQWIGWPPCPMPRVSVLSRPADAGPNEVRVFPHRHFIPRKLAADASRSADFAVCVQQLVWRRRRIWRGVVGDVRAVSAEFRRVSLFRLALLPRPSSLRRHAMAGLDMPWLDPTLWLGLRRSACAGPTAWAHPRAFTDPTCATPVSCAGCADPMA